MRLSGLATRTIAATSALALSVVGFVALPSTAQASPPVVTEPTVGIDIRTKAYLHDLLRELAADGAAILLISSDMPEMVALADRILVMGGFRIVGEVANDGDYGTVSQAIMGAIHRG